MIFEALKCIAEEMNEFFRIKLKVNEDKVIISGIVNQDGTTAIQGENKIVISLVNIEREINGFGGGASVSGGQSVSKAPPATVNLLVMFSAYFASGNYTESLRFLSFVIAYFQSHNVFTRTNSPSLDPAIDKLIMEMAGLTSEQLNNIWGMMGAKYMPSVVYKLRMLTFDDSIIREIRPAVTGIGQQATP